MLPVLLSVKIEDKWVEMSFASHCTLRNALLSIYEYAGRRMSPSDKFGAFLHTDKAGGLRSRAFKDVCLGGSLESHCNGGKVAVEKIADWDRVVTVTGHAQNEALQVAPLNYMLEDHEHLQEAIDLFYAAKDIDPESHVPMLDDLTRVSANMTAKMLQSRSSKKIHIVEYSQYMTIKYGKLQHIEELEPLAFSPVLAADHEDLLQRKIARLEVRRQQIATVENELNERRAAQDRVLQEIEYARLHIIKERREVKKERDVFEDLCKKGKKDFLHLAKLKQKTEDDMEQKRRVIEEAYAKNEALSRETSHELQVLSVRKVACDLREDELDQREKNLCKKIAEMQSLGSEATLCTRIDNMGASLDCIEKCLGAASLREQNNGDASVHREMSASVLALEQTLSAAAVCAQHAKRAKVHCDAGSQASLCDELCSDKVCSALDSAGACVDSLQVLQERTATLLEELRLEKAQNAAYALEVQDLKQEAFSLRSIVSVSESKLKRALDTTRGKKNPTGLVNAVDYAITVMRSMRDIMCEAREKQKSLQSEKDAVEEERARLEQWQRSLSRLRDRTQQSLEFMNLLTNMNGLFWQGETQSLLNELSSVSASVNSSVAPAVESDKDFVCEYVHNFASMFSGVSCPLQAARVIVQFFYPRINTASLQRDLGSGYLFNVLAWASGFIDLSNRMMTDDEDVVTGAFCALVEMSNTLPLDAAPMLSFCHASMDRVTFLEACKSKDTKKIAAFCSESCGFNDFMQAHSLKLTAVAL